MQDTLLWGGMCPASCHFGSPGCGADLDGGVELLAEIVAESFNFGYGKTGEAVCARNPPRQAVWEMKFRVDKASAQARRSMPSDPLSACLEDPQEKLPPAFPVRLRAKKMVRPESKML